MSGSNRICYKGIHPFGRPFLRFRILLLLLLLGCPTAPENDGSGQDTEPPPSGLPDDTVSLGTRGDGGSELLVDGGISPWGPGDTLVTELADASSLDLRPPPRDHGDLDAGGDGDGYDPNRIQPAPLRLRQLSAYQYVESIRVLLGDAAARAVTAPVQAHDEDYLSIHNSMSALSPEMIDLYEANAFAAAEAAYLNASDEESLQNPWQWCNPISLEDTHCMTEVVHRLGRMFFRRPLTEKEMLRWRSVGMRAAAEFANYNLGIEFIVAGLLQSPYFLYVVEVGHPDPSDPGTRWLSSFELATRMSFLLTGATPSEDLLDAAANDELASVTGRQAVAVSLLDSDMAPKALRQFFVERLRLDTLGSLTKDSLLFPTYTPAVRSSLREETLLLFDDIVWERDEDFRKILTAPYTFADATLRSFYDFPETPDAGAGFTRVSYDGGGHRSGFLTQGAFLSAYAHHRRTSPTLRGKFVRESLLCQPVDPPPENVNTALPDLGPDDPPMTMRQRLAGHQSNLSCATCHAIMDPLGFAFEHFDGAGVYRENEQGLTLDTSGVLWGQAFDDAKGLASILGAREEVARCMVRHLYRYAVGHIEVSGEQEQLTLLDYLFELRDYRLKGFLVDLVSSPLFNALGTADGMTADMTADSAHFDDGGVITP